LLAVAAAFFLPPLLGAQIRHALSRKTMNAVALQGVRRIEHALHLLLAIAVFVFGDQAAGEIEIVEDAVGVRPLLEGIIILEKMTVAIAGMGDDERLHRRGIFLHDVDDARIGIDDDLIGEALIALAVHRLVAREMLAEAPMAVKERHAG